MHGLETMRRLNAEREKQLATERRASKRDVKRNIRRVLNSYRGSSSEHALREMADTIESSL